MATKEKKLEDLKRDFTKKRQALMQRIDEIQVAIIQKEASDIAFKSSAETLLD